MNLRQLALNALIEKNPSEKVALVFHLFQENHLNPLVIDPISQNFKDEDIPGKPLKPDLVPPLLVKRRAMHTKEGRATAIHALAHIEFNAINLALDAIWRFDLLPRDYYEDWLKVAKEEAYHFSLLNDHLKSYGYQYGDFPAHNSLWEMAEKTTKDVLARMALVPRTMEARGLDAVPMLRDRFEQVKDHQLVAILDIILRDEIGHVEIGNRWFNYLCEKQSIDSIKIFDNLCNIYNAPILKGPFNISARLSAGFSEEEILVLQQKAKFNS